MLSRSLLARSGPLRLSQVCSRSLRSLYLLPPARCAVPSHPNLRLFSDGPASRYENRVDLPVSRTPSGRCFVGNLPYKVTAQELKDAFSEFGKVESIELLVTDTGLSRGSGFIRFESVAAAVSFVEAHEADPIFVLDRQIRVEHAQRVSDLSKPAEPSSSLVVSHFEGTLEAEARSMFGDFADRILSVRFYKRDAYSRSRLTFFEFRDADVATEAMNAFKNQNGDVPITTWLANRAGRFGFFMLSIRRYLLALKQAKYTSPL